MNGTRSEPGPDGAAAGGTVPVWWGAGEEDFDGGVGSPLFAAASTGERRLMPPWKQPTSWMSKVASCFTTPDGDVQVIDE
ncbi:hypothetical protein GCM10027160_53540 [Streptomyces calidiresistens]